MVSGMPEDISALAGRLDQMTVQRWLAWAFVDKRPFHDVTATRPARQSQAEQRLLPENPHQRLSKRPLPYAPQRGGLCWFLGQAIVPNPEASMFPYLGQVTYQYPIYPVLSYILYPLSTCTQHR